METQSEPLTFEKIKELFKETDEKFKETEQLFRSIAKKSLETDDKFRESRSQRDKDAFDNKKMFLKLTDHFDNQWGKLIESLVEGDLINLFRSRGMDIAHTHTNSISPYGGREYEIDIIAVDNDDIVAVEVKTTLRDKYIKYFLHKLGIFRHLFPEYKDRNIYGAVAYIKSYPQSLIYAEKSGLFTIRATGKSAFIANSADFIPKIF